MLVIVANLNFFYIMHLVFLFSLSYELQPEPDKMNLDNQRIILAALPFLLLELT